MPLDLASLTRNALIKGGCDASMISDLDNNGPIELHLRETAPLRLELLDDQAVILSTVLWHTPLSTNDICSPAVLAPIIDAAPWAAAGALTLLDQNETQWITAAIRPSILEDETMFFEAISDFYERVVAARGALRP